MMPSSLNASGRGLGGRKGSGGQREQTALGKRCAHEHVGEASDLIAYGTAAGEVASGPSPPAGQLVQKIIPKLSAGGEGPLAPPAGQLVQKIIPKLSNPRGNAYNSPFHKIHSMKAGHLTCTHENRNVLQSRQRYRRSPRHVQCTIRLGLAMRYPKT